MAQSAKGDGGPVIMVERTHGAEHGAAHGHGDHHDVSEDKSAAFTGLIVGAVVLFCFLFGMVEWTNHHLNAREGGTAAAAEAAK